LAQAILVHVRRPVFRTMGAGQSSHQPSPAHGEGVSAMRCRSEDKVPKCFRYVKCPYPKVETVHGVCGDINYSLIGPPDGEVIVCFHGLNGSRVLFQDFGNILGKEAGYRVLSFDLYGHGLSNAPKVDLCPWRACSCCGPPRGRYDLQFFVEQTDDLLSRLGLGAEKVNLVGFSLGGTLAIAFAERFPERVLRIIAMSPTGFLQKVPKLYYLLRLTWCCLIPLAPHFLCTCWYRRERFAKSLRNEDHDVEDEVIDNLWSRFVWQLYVKRGVASSTLAILNRINWFNLRPLFSVVGSHPRPVLLVWGERDSLNPVASVAQEVKKYFSNAHLLVIRGAGHIAICDQPRQTILGIWSFLRLPPNACVQNIQLAPPPVRRSRPSAGPQASGARPEQRIGEGGPAAELHSLPLKAERMDQMPVPMILGHTEDIGRGSDPESLVPVAG